MEGIPSSLHIRSEEGVLALVENSKHHLLLAPNGAMERWVQLERFVQEFQNRPLSERIRDKRRLAIQKWIHSAPVRAVFGKAHTVTQSQRKQLDVSKRNHTALVKDMRELVDHVKTLATTTIDMGYVWTALVEADASALVEQSHAEFLKMGQGMANLCLSTGTQILATIVMPLEAKLDKLAQLHTLLDVEDEMRLLVVAAARKLERATDKTIFDRQNELKQAQLRAARMTTDLQVILEWTDTMRPELIRHEMNRVSMLLHEMCVSARNLLVDSNAFPSLQIEAMDT
ncbi:hypothetical protein LEN26_008767 [Aphanomyces euteiches]|nr:hypothetical protein AeMF1_003602 [Aphanomyces euteiches]KAH9130192.1 hypothetical protein LEN26_008767 [Aphanomyces euteiches]KAH9183968.1 hypothetical protein AeNC1_014056 [Aphanomyces euteiches]